MKEKPTSYFGLLRDQTFLGISFWRKIYHEQKTIFKSLKWFLRDFREFQDQNEEAGYNTTITLFPQLFDKDDSSGVSGGHYFHQDLLVAKCDR